MYLYKIYPIKLYIYTKILHKIDLYLYLLIYFKIFL